MWGAEPQQRLARVTTLFALVLFAVGVPLLPTPGLKSTATLLADLVLVLGFYAALRSGGRINQTRLDAPALALLLIASLATLLAINPLVSYIPSTSRGDGLLVYLAYLGAAVMTARLSRTDISILLTALLAGGALIGSVAILQYYGLDATHLFRNRALVFGRSWGTLDNPIFLGGYLCLVFPLSLALTSSPTEKHWQWYAIVSVLLYATLMASGTRSAWFACGVAIVLLAVLLRTSSAFAMRWALLALAFTTVTAIMILTRPQVSFGQRALSALDPSDPSLQGRLFIWMHAIPLLFQRPILGWGFSSLLSQHLGMGSQDYFKTFGHQPLAIDTMHNEMLHIIFSIGLLGLGAYLWVWGTVFRSLRDAFRAGGPQAGVAAGLIGCMAAYAAWLQLGWTEVGPANVFWTLAGAAVALGRIASNALCASEARKQAIPPLSPFVEPVRSTSSKSRLGFGLMEFLVVSVMLAGLVVLVSPSYHAARERVSDAQRIEEAEGWHILQHAAYEEAREIGRRWRTLAQACFARTRRTASCAGNRAIGFLASAINWRFDDSVEYITAPASIMMKARAAIDDPFVIGETYTIILNTITGKASEKFGPQP